MRYFIEVSYKGTRYAGFQIQRNANTVQSEVEKALSTILRDPIELTGSSRTDAGVHALQNYFHFDIDRAIEPRAVYNLNALLPLDIAVKAIFPVAEEAHSRFLAVSREYKYYITQQKDPFSTDTAWFYPYNVDLGLLNEAGRILFRHLDYTSFSKRNTQVSTFNCIIMKSEWCTDRGLLIYNVKANRFLRGMVRGLVGTMLLVGRKKTTLAEFEDIIVAKDCTKASFATPAHGLYLVEVAYPSFEFLV